MAKTRKRARKRAPKTEPPPIRRSKADARWYARDEKPHDAIMGVVHKLLQDNRRDQLRLWRNLYLDEAAEGFGKQRIYRPGIRARFNLIRNSVETMQARCGKDLPRPMLCTIGGGFRLQRKAKKAQRFIDGDWERLNASGFRRRQVLDAAIFGEGIIKVYAEHGQVCWRRVWCGDLLRHPREEAAGHVRTLYEIALVDQGVLAELYPEERKTIELLGPPPSAVVETQDDADALVLVVEAWHLPSGKDDDGNPTGGRHAIVIDDATLLDEEWTDDRFPFSRLCYSVDPSTGRGVGLPERMAGAQSEQNRIAELVSDIARLMTPKYVVPAGSKLSIDSTSNDIEVWETTGEAPIVLSADPALLGALQYGLQQRESAYQEQGIDTYAAESKKPADLSSGKAAIVHRDVNAERHVIFAQEIEQATVDLATLHIRTCEKIVEDDGGENLVAHEGKRALEELKWSDIVLGDTPWLVRAEAVSKLSQNIEGKFRQLVEMQVNGWISPAEARELYDLPDIERSNDLAFARRDLARKLIEAALDGESTAPTEVCDLPYLIEAGTQQFAIAQTEGADETELVALLDLIGAAQGILDQKAAQAAAQQPAPAPMPAAPPMGALPPPMPAAPEMPMPQPGGPPGMLPS